MINFADTPVEMVEFIAMLGFGIMGLSHIVQPKMWVDYFFSLHQKGTNGVITSVANLQLLPAIIIVTLHQVWAGAGLILTLYGWLLLLKCTLALLLPSFGIKGLSMAKEHGNRGYIVAGIGLSGISASCAWALYFPTAG